MSTSNIRVRRVSGRQLDLLWEFLNSHRDIAVAYNRSLQAKEYAKRKWMEIAEILNSQGEGAHKDWRGWSKYWVDYKAKLKKRAAALRSSHSRTGGGPSTEPPLTDIENKFLQILGEDFGQGLAGVRVEPFSEQPSTSTAAADATEESPSIIIEIEGPLLQHPTPEVPLQEASPQGGPSDADGAAGGGPLSPGRTPTLSPQATTPPPALAPAQARAAAAVRSPRRRRHRREPPMSQEAARRALVQSSQQKADAAVRSARALERIGQGVVDIHNTLERIERTINGAFPRAAE